MSVFPSLSGKWWGRKDVTPVIGLHGFEDNAGTFDRLVPLLNVQAFLALDAPGHGRSSHIPNGMVYTFIDFIVSLRRVIQHYGWQRFSIIGHSYGSAMGHIYSSLYPSEVAKFVSLDCARTLMSTMGNSGLRIITEKSLKSDKDILKDPPAYTSEEIVDAFCTATLDSVQKEYAEPLLTRGLNVHPKRPNHFYFSRDPKLRFGDFHRPNNELLTESAKNLKCDVLAILGTEGFINLAPDSEASKTFFRFEELLKKSAASYERHDVEGSHHVHLNNPERVAPLVNKFLNN